jgi:hypothetical protein
MRSVPYATVITTGASPADEASRKPSSLSAVPSWSSCGTCWATTPPGSTTSAPATTTQRSTQNVRSATATGDQGPALGRRTLWSPKAEPSTSRVLSPVEDPDGSQAGSELHDRKRKIYGEQGESGDDVRNTQGDIREDGAALVPSHDLLKRYVPCAHRENCNHNHADRNDLGFPEMRFQTASMRVISETEGATMGLP